MRHITSLHAKTTNRLSSLHEYGYCIFTNAGLSVQRFAVDNTAGLDALFSDGHAERVFQEKLGDAACSSNNAKRLQVCFTGTATDSCLSIMASIAKDAIVQSVKRLLPPTTILSYSLMKSLAEDVPTTQALHLDYPQNSSSLVALFAIQDDTKLILAPGTSFKNLVLLIVCI